MPYRRLEEDISLDNFEYTMYEKKRVKVTSIKKLRRILAFRKIKIACIAVLFVYIGINVFLTIAHSVNVKRKEMIIQKYETVLADKIKENEKYATKIAEIVVDKGIREKAILELSMTIPTANHIIYFDNRNRGYVHYDK